jgi:hypothetical protein
VSIIFILAAIATIALEYLLSLKPISAGPSISALLRQPLVQLNIQLFPTVYFFSSLSLQMSASVYLILFVVSLIMAVILIASAFGFAYRKKWGYYLSFLSSVFLIVTPVLAYILGYQIIYVVGSVIFAILGVLFILYLRGDVKKEF